MPTHDLTEHSESPAITKDAAREWLDLLNANPSKPYFVALSGGRSAQALFTTLAAAGRPDLFSNVHFFWTDERLVPPTDLESNFLLAQQTLFQPLEIPRSHIHRIRAELKPQAAVAEANAEIFGVVPEANTGLPALDLVLLGLGEDGHIASLFPNAPNDITESQSPYLYITNSPKPPPQRISLSYAAIGAAKRIWVLVLGSGKERALRESVSGEGRTPLGRVLHLRGDTKIFTDITTA